MKSSLKKGFYSKMFSLSFPVMLQHLILSSLNMVDMAMVGSLGTESIAAIGLSNQLFFLFSILILSVSTGGSIFIAQFWGKKDLKGIQDFTSITIKLSVVLSLVFTMIAVIFPRQFLGFYTTDEVVKSIGVKYLKIVGISYLFTCISISFSSILRSIEKVKIPLFVSLVALGINTTLNFFLIYGKFGFPVLGVEGLAIATMIARVIECISLIYLMYVLKVPFSLNIVKHFYSGKEVLKKYFKTSGPVIFNSLQWAIGITIYNVVFARISTEAIAAYNLALVFEQIAFVVFIGLSAACNTMIGMKIGANEQETAKEYITEFLKLNLLLAILIGIIMFHSKELVLKFYKVDFTSLEYARTIINILACVLWIKTSNMVIIRGGLTGGGDTKYSLVLSIFTMWGIGIPIALLCSFLFKLELQYILVFIMLEEIIKLYGGVVRLKSNKWINDVT